MMVAIAQKGKKPSKTQLEKYKRVNPFLLVISIPLAMLLAKLIWGSVLFDSANYPSLFLKYIFIALNYSLLFIASWFFTIAIYSFFEKRNK